VFNPQQSGDIMDVKSIIDDLAAMPDAPEEIKMASKRLSFLEEPQFQEA